MKLLMLGDIVASAGRRMVKEKLPALCQDWAVDLVVANAENAAGGLGLDPASVSELHEAGIAAMTLGNHSWARRAFLREIEGCERVLRPANVPVSWPGKDHLLIDEGETKVLLINLLGRVFMDACDDPFAFMDRNLEDWKRQYRCKIVVVDFHAEATAEKMAMGWHLCDRVSAVLGTHTHVQTADERILGMGTAFITDVGMCGPADGVLGMSREAALRRFREGLPAAYEPETGAAVLQAVLLDIHEASGQCRHIRRISLREEA